MRLRLPSKSTIATGLSVRRGAALAVAAAGFYGLIAGWWIPRGPVATSGALVTMAVSLVVGVVAGLAMRSRWAMLLAPLPFIATFELARIGAVGATVDGIHLGSTYGVLAFGVGRGFHGVLALGPMMLARRSARRRRAVSATMSPSATGGREPGSGRAAASPRWRLSRCWR